MSVTFVTANQKDLLKAALELTDSEGFMEDAIAIAAFEHGEDGAPTELSAVAVFECIRAGHADLHFGMTRPASLTLELIQATLMIAFRPQHLNLSRLIFRVPEANRRAIIALIKIGCCFEYRERASLSRGRDAIVFSLDRETVEAIAGPEHREEVAPSGASDDQE